MKSEITLSLIITCIIALGSFLSPPITALINNHHQLKLKRLDLEAEQYKQTVLYKRNLFENYLKQTGKVIFNKSYENLGEYGELFLQAYVYAPIELRQDMSELNRLIYSYEWSKANDFSQDVSEKISSLLQKL